MASLFLSNPNTTTTPLSTPFLPPKPFFRGNKKNPRAHFANFACPRCAVDTPFGAYIRGYYHAHGRSDDTMNLGGIKVGSVEIECICNAADNGVLETAAIVVPPSGGGPEQLVIAVVFKDSENTTADLNELRISFNSAVQKKLNPLFRVSQVVPLSSRPRTASNKVMRRVLRQQLAQGDRNPKL